MPPLNTPEPIEVFDDADPNAKLIYWPDERLVRVQNPISDIDITIPLALFDAFVESVYGKQQAVNERRRWRESTDSEAQSDISLATEELIASGLRIALSRQVAETNPQIDLTHEMDSGYEEMALNAQQLTLAIDSAPAAQRPQGWGDVRG